MTKRPRILVLFGGAILYGQERGNIEALVALQKLGCKVLILIRDEKNNVFLPPVLNNRELKFEKVPYIEHRMPGRLIQFLLCNPISLLLANWHFIWIYLRFRPTHIHAFNPMYVLNFLPVLLAIRTPMIFRAGDEPTVHNWFWKALWWCVVRRTSRFVANSEFIARSLYANGVPEGEATVIYNKPPAREEDTRPLPIFPAGPQHSRVVYVGQISQHKGVHMLIEAFKQIANEFPLATLVAAGRISEWSGDAWARQLRDRTINDPQCKGRVAFLGEVWNVDELLAKSGIHAAPSLFDDPSPNVVMEAKQAGLPSVVFPRGGIPEMVENGVDGIVCSAADVSSLAGALRVYLSNPDRAISDGNSARRSLERLKVPEFAQRWLRIYE